MTLSFLKEHRYRKFKKHLLSLAQADARRRGIVVRDAADTMLGDRLVGIDPVPEPIIPLPVATTGRHYTPRQMTDIVKHLLSLEPELAAYMAMESRLRGDVLLAFEKIRAVAPEGLDQGAAVLARALCIMKNLSAARDTFAHLGTAYWYEALPENQVAKLRAEKLVPESTVVDIGNGLKRLRDDVTTRRLVGDKLHELNPEIALLITRGAHMSEGG